MNLTPKSLKLKKSTVFPSRWEGKPYWMTRAAVWKLGDMWVLNTGRYEWDNEGHKVCVDSNETIHDTRRAALEALHEYGNVKVKTTNILNPAAGEFDIDLRSKGSCCDPGTERYHSM